MNKRRKALQEAMIHRLKLLINKNPNNLSPNDFNILGQLSGLQHHAPNRAIEIVIDELNGYSVWQKDRKINGLTINRDRIRYNRLLDSVLTKLKPI